MLEKIRAARRMRRFISTCANIKNRKVFLKCYRAYVFQCILGFKEEFVVRVGSEYYDSFRLRLKSFIEYMYYVIYTAIWRIVPSRSHRPRKANYYISHGIPKPAYIKKHIYVSESALEYFLDETGFEIVDEDIKVLESIYYIQKV